MDFVPAAVALTLADVARRRARIREVGQTTLDDGVLRRGGRAPLVGHGDNDSSTTAT